MSLRIISRYLGLLLWAEAVFLLPPAVVSLIYGEHRVLFSVLVTVGLCALLGLVLFLVGLRCKHTLYPREGFVIAGSGWLLISLMGAIPFVLSGDIPHLGEAFFETVSGFTTTGATVIANVEAMSRGMLFWRSFTHWLGGVGVLVFLLAIVRAQSGGGNALHLLRAETPGPQVGKMLPKTRQSVRTLLGIYCTLSLINLVFLLAGGMPLFDALCTMFGTAGTGGCGIRADSMASYSPYLQTVCMVFMFLFGANLSLYYLLLRRDWKSVLRDEELRLYAGIALGAIAAITICLVLSGFGGAGYSLHHSAFMVSSIMSTSGFSTVDYTLWPEFAQSILLLLMIFGSMAGSTAGGFKIGRLLILLKAAHASIHRMLHPRSVKAVRINNKILDEKVVSNSFLFLLAYCGILMVANILISVDGLSMETNYSAVLTSLNNVGSGFAGVGPSSNFEAYSTFSKIVLSIVMLLGRLEIFPLLMLLSPSTWKRKA